MSAISISIKQAEPIELLRCGARAVLIAIPLLVLLPLHMIWHLLRQPSPWAMLFLRIAARVLGVKVRVVGKPLRWDVFFVANHVSWIDIPILAGISGTAFVAQDGVQTWPIIGWLARLNRTIFVSRSDRLNVGGQIAELRDAIAENWSVTLFPEGTTSDGLGLLPFKPSLFETLVPPPKPMLIQPVLLDFGDVGPEVGWLGAETGWESAWKAFTRKGSYPVNVYFLEPFDPALCRDRKEISMLARNRITEAMAAARA